MFKPFIIVALLATAAPAFAAADPASVAAATALVDQLGVREQISGSMARVIGEMRSGAVITRMLQAQPGFDMARSKQPAKFDEVIKKMGAMQASAAQKVVTAETPNVVNAAVQSYATRYTTAELRGLSEFYKSPLGIAMTAKQPMVMQDVAVAQQKLMGAKMQNAMQALGPQFDAELKRLQPTAPPK